VKIISAHGARCLLAFPGTASGFSSAALTPALWACVTIGAAAKPPRPSTAAGARSRTIARASLPERRQARRKPKTSVSLRGSGLIG